MNVKGGGSEMYKDQQLLAKVLEGAIHILPVVP